jgi:hypothetical protein
MNCWTTYDGPSSFDGGFVGGPARRAILARRSTRGWGEPQPLAPSTGALRGGMHPIAFRQGFDAFFRGRGGRSRRRRSRRPPIRPTVPLTGAISTRRRSELKRLVTSRWTFPALVERRRRFYLPRGDEPTPILSLLVDAESTAQTVQRRSTRPWHPPARCSGPTPCSQRTLMPQVIFACGVVPQALDSSSWRVRCSMNGLTIVVGPVLPEPNRN